LKFIPSDRILLETDSPYLAPLSHRGRRNEPVFVLETRDVVASSMGASASFVERSTRENSMKVFRL